MGLENWGYSNLKIVVININLKNGPSIINILDLILSYAIVKPFLRTTSIIIT